MKWLFLLLLTFFLSFTVYPVLFLFLKSTNVSIHLFLVVWSNISVRQSFTNSILLALSVTAATSIIAIPLALTTSLLKIPGRNFWKKAFLLPLVAPPFVSAIGMRQVLSRFGPVNLILMKWGITDGPFNFLGAGLTGIFILQVLHLYPIIYLNMTASLENLEASCIESAENIGASFWQTLRKIILPMSLPGYFAGAFLVFVWSLTDLGTPLVFDYPNLIPVLIFQSLTDIYSNPAGYVLVIFICIIAIMLFFTARYFIEKISYIGIVRYKTTRQPASISKSISIIILIYLGGLLFTSLLPHIAVILNSLSEKWFFTVVPERWTFHYYREVFHHPIAKNSLINSVVYSGLAGIITTIISLTIGLIIYRSQTKGRQILESFVIFPMAIPGIVFAFAFVIAFSQTFLDPRNFPVFLLVIAYVLRRLPFSTRSIMANFQQVDISCEEAGLNLGASKWTTFVKITVPMLKNGIVAGFIFSFAFSMMEVSSSLILVSKQQFFPIAKGIYQLAGRITDGPYIASALGVLGMVVSFVALIAIYKLTGRDNISISI